MSETPNHRESAREFLRIATQRIEEAHRARDHFIHLARDYGLEWADISHETGLSIPTCRKLRSQYLDEIRGVAA